jgi:hypothetical protein
MPTGNYISFSVSNAQIANVISQINAASVEKQAAIKQEIVDTTYAIEGAAKRNAPVASKFGGLLRAEIHSQIRSDDLGGRVWVNVPYGPFQEFGTGTMVSIPEGWEAFAAQFRGKGIRQINMPARLYMFRAWEIQVPIFLANIKRILGVK